VTASATDPLSTVAVGRAAGGSAPPADAHALSAVQATSSIVICSLPRSGSWLLAEALDRTGVAGHAREYLRPELERGYARDWGVAAGDVHDFTRGMLRAGTTAGGVFALKVHWHDCMRYLARARASGYGGNDADVLRAVLPAPRFVHIVRRDTVRQAVSWARALDSDAWWQVDGDSAANAAERWDPDFEKIEVLQDLLAEGERGWRAFFAAGGIAPVEVMYEDLVADYAPTVRRVLDQLGIAHLADDGAGVPPPKLRRQADAMSERWVQEYLHLQRAAAVPVARVDAAPPASALTPGALWLRREQPFPHVVAHDVFRADVFARIEAAYTELLTRPGAFTRNTSGYDVFSHTFDAATRGPLAMFCSREWHDLAAAVCGVRGTGHVFAGLHHHGIASPSGSPHNDLNPGFFARPGSDNDVLLASVACNYFTGIAAHPGVTPVETVRGIAMIFFVCNGPWRPGDGGEVGLYRSASDPVDRPALTVPPIDNSMLLFECTPNSLHAFMSNRTRPRNSVILWLHRARTEVVARWGEEAIIRWRGFL
jgi:LPS sulfotransferase NodH